MLILIYFVECGSRNLFKRFLKIQSIQSIRIYLDAFFVGYCTSLSGSSNESQILNFSLHYNIAVIKIKSVALLLTANLRDLDDSVSLYPLRIYPDTSRMYRKPSSSFG